MISVIVPVYNSGPYLKQCLNSILEQSCKDIEVICVNDGSSDDSQQILTEAAQQDVRIKILSQRNSGVSSARNAGLNIARGKYITFVDSDDELEPDMYEVLLNLAEKYHADVAHCGYKKIHLDGSAKNVCGTEELLIQDGIEASKCLLSGEHFTGGLWNKLYRAELVQNTRFDETLKINEDVLFNAQVFRRAGTTVFYDVPKYHYFERQSSACSRTSSIRKKQDTIAAAEKILGIYKNSPVEVYAAKKMYYSLLDLYRAYLFDGIRKNREACGVLHQQVLDVAPLCGDTARRNQMNYGFMRHFPVLYKLVYGLYDRIRKPNWDL